MGLTPRQAITAANLWRSGMDTKWIAQRVAANESTIYNHIGGIKELAKRPAIELERELDKMIKQGAI